MECGIMRPYLELVLLLGMTIKTYPIGICMARLPGIALVSFGFIVTSSRQIKSNPAAPVSYVGIGKFLLNLFAVIFIEN